MFRSSIGAAALLVLYLVASAVIAQEEPVLSGDAPPGGKWASRCITSGRQAGLDCTMSLRMVNQAGQTLGAASLRVGAAGDKPVISVTTPLGLFIPGGVSIDVDGAGGEALQLQTCDRGGCYAGATVTDQLITAMQSGKTLNIVFSDMGKQQVKLPLTLSGFADAYQAIK